MTDKIIASYYIETGTDYRPYCHGVQNVARAAERCGINLACLAKAFLSLPDDAKIVMNWNPEDEGDADELTYIFELAKT